MADVTYMHAVLGHTQIHWRERVPAMIKARHPSSSCRTSVIRVHCARATAGDTALTGTPSDEVDEILATGRSGVTTIFVSMSARHPRGADAEYLAWHSLDHRPEQYRLATLRSSVRLVSTPSCRAARRRAMRAWTPPTT